MAKALRIGDLFTLPSGRKARVMVAADPARPWGAVETGHLWHVCREHGLQAAGVAFVMDPARKHPMQLDEVDARALAQALNEVRGAKAPAAT